MNSKDCELFDSIKSMVASACGDDSMTEEMTMETRLIEDLGMDSLSVVNLITALEDRFGVEFEDEFLLIENINSLSSIFYFIKERNPD